MMRILRGLLLSTTAVLVLAASPAYAGERFFHAHMDAYSNNKDCGPSEWSSSYGLCYAFDEHTAAQHGTRSFYYVHWCPDTSCLPARYRHLTLPAGSSRWMALCESRGNDWCFNAIVAAVRMPNGPFSVVSGHWNGHQLKAADPGRPNESRGGPLFLYVGFHGYKSNGAGKRSSHGYVFGFRGYLEW